MADDHTGFSRLGLVLLAMLTLGWGLNWPIMKIVLQDVPPLTFRSVCLLAGGMGVLLLARLAGQTLAVPSAYWSRLAILTLCNVIGWNILVIYGIGLMPAGRAALLAYTMPLWSVALSIWLLHERVTAARVAALVLGMAGVAVLMSADIDKMRAAFAGALLILGAAISWGLGVVLLKRFAVPIPTVTLTGWTMLGGAIPVTLVAIPVEHDQWRAVGLYPALGIVYNVVVAFMFCYWAWNRIVLMVPVAVSSLSSLVTPVVGVLSGAWLLNERITWRELIAGGLILFAVALALRAPRRGPAARTDTPLV